MTLIARATPFILVALIFMASLVHAKPVQFADKSVGLVALSPDRTPQGVVIDVFSEPADDASKIGALHGKPEAEPSNFSVITEKEEPNPDAGLFDTKTKLVRTEHPLQTYVSPSGIISLYMMENRGNWIRIEQGWIRRTDAETFGMKMIDWPAVSQHEFFLEFHLPESNEALASIAKTDLLRSKADFLPIGSVSLYKSVGDNDVLITVEEPLRMALMDRTTQSDGEWLKVFVLLGVCDSAGGKTDYREGTIGWIRRTTALGAPSIYRSEEKC